jgi:hypothetical protein
MKIQLRYIAGITASLLLAGIISACKKEKNNPTGTATPTAEVAINLEHMWGTGNANFALHMDLIHPTTQDTLNFTTFKYYISNFRLQRTDGSWWTHPESYFLVDLSAENTTMLRLENVPIGSYQQLEYTLGVDSTRNVSGAQSGALSVANNMFWSWNSGYIMLKAEGISPNSATGSFAFHLGGFAGTDNLVTIQSTDFNGVTLSATANHESEVHLIVNPAALWTSSGSINGTNAIHMPGAAAKTMAGNFYGGILFDHLHQ